MKTDIFNRRDERSHVLGPDLAKANQPRRNLDALTGLRFFAAINVVLYHFARPALPRWTYPLPNVVACGYVSVSLFFVLSGFILSYSYLDKKDGSMRGSARSFYTSRFARIYPAYFLAFLLAAPTNIITSLHVNHLVTAIVKLVTGAILVLTLQQAWTPWTAWYWNFPAWSISVETFFYVVFPWIAPRLAKLRLRSCVMLAAALWIFSLFAPTLLYLWKGTTGAPELNDHLQMAIEFNPILRLPEFLIGILLGRFYDLGYIPKLSSSLLSYAASLGILAVFAFCPFIPHPLLANGLMAPLFALLIYSLAQGEGLLANLLSRPWLVLLGEVSYGIYILQIPVALVLRMPPPYHALVDLAIYLIVLISVSILSWKFIESPLRTRLRTWLSPATLRNDLQASPGERGVAVPGA
jgi:peptidoglycan/LPS O-acetylase OafA/YrhL